MRCSSMRVAPPQNVWPQYVHSTCGVVSCSRTILTLFQMGPSRVGAALRLLRTPAPLALAVCLGCCSPRRAVAAATASFTAPCVSITSLSSAMCEECLCVLGFSVLVLEWTV
eukprot:3624709-Prymnesium_polylepis.1